MTALFVDKPLALSRNNAVISTADEKNARNLHLTL
jgi:hypothetical protein